MRKLSEELYGLYMGDQEDVLISYDDFVVIRDKIQQLENREDQCKEYLMTIYALSHDVENLNEWSRIHDYISNKLKLV